MKRILCIISSMNAGGAETFLMKIYRKLDRTQYQIDFCINVPEKCYYEEEINELGGKIFRIPSKSENPKEFKKQLTNIVKSKEYKSVIRITSNAMGFWDLKIAKKAGAEVCCARSSNSSDGNSKKALLAHTLGRIFYSKYVDVALAPSDLAAIYTFGKKAYLTNKVTILNNAVDMDIYAYNDEIRNNIRKKYNIEKNTLLIGHIGRFTEQKNHRFLIEVFSRVKKNNENTKLLLVGKGPLEEEIKTLIRDSGFEQDVIFTGIRSDISDLLSAMDVFVFPSLYEGMPNAVIEAQASGLPCVVSDKITKSVDITGLVEFVSLSDSVEIWEKKVLKRKNFERISTREIFFEKKYDIQSTVSEFVDVVFNNKN